MLCLELLVIDSYGTDSTSCAYYLSPGILRVLLAYFSGLTRDEAPFVKIPLNQVMKLTPRPCGCDKEIICLLDNSEMVDDGQDVPMTSIQETS